MRRWLPAQTLGMAPPYLASKQRPAGHHYLQPEVRVPFVGRMLTNTVEQRCFCPGNTLQHRMRWIRRSIARAASAMSSYFLEVLALPAREYRRFAGERFGWRLPREFGWWRRWPRQGRVRILLGHRTWFDWSAMKNIGEGKKKLARGARKVRAGLKLRKDWASAAHDERNYSPWNTHATKPFRRFMIETLPLEQLCKRVLIG